MFAGCTGKLEQNSARTSPARSDRASLRAADSHLLIVRSVVRGSLCCLPVTAHLRFCGRTNSTVLLAGGAGKLLDDICWRHRRTRASSPASVCTKDVGWVEQGRWQVYGLVIRVLGGLNLFLRLRRKPTKRANGTVDGRFEVSFRAARVHGLLSKIAEARETLLEHRSERLLRPAADGPDVLRSRMPLPGQSGRRLIG